MSIQDVRRAHRAQDAEVKPGARAVKIVNRAVAARSAVWIERMPVGTVCVLRRKIRGNREIAAVRPFPYPFVICAPVSAVNQHHRGKTARRRGSLRNADKSEYFVPCASRVKDRFQILISFRKVIRNFPHSCEAVAAGFFDKINQFLHVSSQCSVVRQFFAPHP